MRLFIATWCTGAALIMGLPITVSAAPLPLVSAVRRGDCQAAAKLANEGVRSDDDPSIFVVGRMLDEGLCTKQDKLEAAKLFARAAELGNHAAALEYAAKIGLGQGSEQSYELAGRTCRSAGFDPKVKLSDYSLGYACTVRGVAGTHLRETLPKGAFLSGTGDLVVEFSPASGHMRIRSTPHVARSDAGTGSYMHPPVVDAQHEINDAWRDALAAVPTPDAARLDDQAVELALDVDLTLEAGRKIWKDSFIPLFEGDLSRKR